MWNGFIIGFNYFLNSEIFKLTIKNSNKHKWYKILSAFGQHLLNEETNEKQRKDLKTP